MCDTNEYFKRQIALWGEDTQRSLTDKSVAIIGCGGLGSTLAITLGSSGIGKFHLVDFDTVSIHNLHRQIAYTMEDEGKSKCVQLAKLLQNRYDGVEITACDESFELFSKREVSFDLIIDATDNLPSRAQIDLYAKSKNIPWVHGSVEGFNGYVCLFDKALFKVFGITDRKPGGIAPPIVSFIASLQANYALRYLAGLSVEKDILNYLYFDPIGALQHKKLTIVY